MEKVRDPRRTELQRELTDTTRLEYGVGVVP